MGQPVNIPSPAPAAAQPPTPVAAANSFTNSNYSQPIDTSALLQKTTGSSAAPGGPTASLSPFNPQTATQDLKTAIGIGGGGAPGGGKVADLAPSYASSALSYSSGSATSAYSTATSSGTPQAFTGEGSAFSPIKRAVVTNSSPTGKALPSPRLPSPSKISSSAVEMPGDSLSTLDVQFGGLDLQFGTGSSESVASYAGTGFDLSSGGGGSAGPPPSKDLDKVQYSSIPVVSSVADKSMDGYKQVPSVKDGSSSLFSAHSAVVIKPSSSSDAVPGNGSVPRSDKQTSGGYSAAAQRLPEPAALTDRPKPIVSDNSLSGYNSSSYAYQGSGQQVKPIAQYGQSNAAYTNTSSYDRASYPRSNAELGGPVYARSTTNSYNSPTTGPNSYNASTVANSGYSVPAQGSTNSYNSG